MDSDLDILENKNAQLKKQKLITAGLIILSLLLLSLVMFMVITSRLQPPSDQPTVKVLDRNLYEGKYGLKVPSVITVGELFDYQTSGTKYVENNPEVRLQTVCVVKGSQVIQTIGTFTSVGVGKGDFDIKRSTSVPPSTKNVESDDCELQSIATYTFYTVDENGNESSFNVSETAQSNKFKLIIPEDVDEMSVSSSSSTVSNQNKTGSTSTQPENLNVAQSNTPPNNSSGNENEPNEDDNPNGVVPEQPEPRFIRRTVNGVLDFVGL